MLQVYPHHHASPWGERLRVMLPKIRYPLALLGLICCLSTALGQLNADPEMSTTGSCSPIVHEVDAHPNSVNIELTCTQEITSERIQQLQNAILEAISIVFREPLPTDSFTICIVSDGDTLTIDAFTFPYSDIAKHARGAEFIDLLSKIPGVSEEQISNSSIFRYADEEKITRELGTPLGRGNRGVLIAPNAVIQESFDNNDHLAFTYLRSASEALCR